MSGRLWRLHVPDQPVRGAYVSLGPEWAELVAKRGYGEDAARLLGQAMCAMPMLGEHLKIAAKMSFQISQADPLRLLAVQADGHGDVRGMVKLAGEKLDAAQLKGQLVVTLEPQEGGKNYQGIVSLQGDGPAAWLREYFEQSEQVATRLVLCADQHQAAGFMLQSVPGASTDPASVDIDWQAAVDAFDVDFLPAEPGEWLSTMLEMDLQVSEEAGTVRVHCPCSSASVSNMLVNLGQAELETVLQEQGEVEVECGFCGENYVFDQAGVAALFNDKNPDSAIH